MGKKTILKLSLYQSIKQYYEIIILGQVQNKSIKASSAEMYAKVLKYLEPLKRKIQSYDKDDIIQFFNGIKKHRCGAYCYFLIKRVFADETEKGNLKRNPIATLKNPFSQKRCGHKGTWLNIQEQKILKSSLDDSVFSKEILFYLMSGCRLREAYDARVDFEKCTAYITRRKTEYSGVQSTTIPLSPKFCDYIKPDWNKMFKMTSHALTTKISTFLKSLGMTDKSTHDLRHTFSSNLYYLSLDAKKQQYLMGHASIQQTFDTYTTLDLSVTRQDILELWGDFYPQF